MSTPVVSVVMPCYNAAETVVQALESIRWQTMEEWECLVVDDGSTDGSKELVAALAQRDRRIRLIQQDRAGAALARNKGVESARGRYVQFLDADDLLLREKLKHGVDRLESGSGGRAVYCEYALLTEDGEFFRTLPAMMPHEDPLQSFLFHWNIDFIVPIQSFLFPSHVVRRYPFRASHAEDVECWIRMALGGTIFEHMESVDVVYRIRTGSVSRDEERLYRDKIALWETLRRMPELERFAGRFDRHSHWLQRRLAIAMCMSGKRREAWERIRSEWGSAPIPERAKMLLWYMLLGVISTGTAVRLRQILGSVRLLRTGGWSQYRSWSPPEYLKAIILSERNHALGHSRPT